MENDQTGVHKLEARINGESLLSLLTQNGLSLETDCGGLGICGKCKVKLMRGAASPHHPDELGYLRKEELDAGIRMACLCQVNGEVVISMPQPRITMQIQEQGRTYDFPLNPVIKKQYIVLKPQENESLYNCLLRGSGGSIDNALTIARALGSTSPKLTAITFKGRLIGIEEGDTCESCYGVAIDIGTTTVVVELVDLKTGRTMSTASMINPQFSLGSDVLSRIHYARQESVNINKLASLLRDAINELTASLFETAGADLNHCYIISVAGNTVMLHLFLGIYPQSLGSYPYRPVFLEALQFKASDLGIQASSFAVLQCLPGLSGFVGADISAGLLALNITGTSEIALFIDMGTNGEIVVCFNGRIIATSTAAGPALEGMNISCGMKASSGAIDHIKLRDGKLVWTTIGSTAPLGLCGSGLLDMVAALLNSGVIQKSGRIIEPGKAKLKGVREIENTRCFQLLPPSPANNKGIYLSQQDVRQVQLAKGALAAGIKLLLRQVGLKEPEIKTVYLAGGFGYYLKPETLITLGLFPSLWKDRLVYVGNTSLAGARLAMLCSGLMERNQDRLKDVEFYDLTSCNDFKRVFTYAMTFHEYINS